MTCLIFKKSFADCYRCIRLKKVRAVPVGETFFCKLYKLCKPPVLYGNVLTASKSLSMVESTSRFFVTFVHFITINQEQSEGVYLLKY